MLNPPSIADVESGKTAKPKRKTTDFTERATKWWRDRGFTIQKTEYKIPIPRYPGSRHPGFVRRDLFNLGDFAAVHPDYLGTFYIQVTSHSNLSARVKKTLSAEALPAILDARNSIILQAFGDGKVVTKCVEWHDGPQIALVENFPEGFERSR